MGTNALRKGENTEMGRTIHRLSEIAVNPQQTSSSIWYVPEEGVWMEPL